MKRKSTNPAVIAHDARTCHICASGKAWFSFGPPLTDVEIWACSVHHTVVSQRIAAAAAAKVATEGAARTVVAKHASAPVPIPLPTGDLFDVF